MKAADVVVGETYVARASKYDRKWKVEAVKVERVIIEEARELKDSTGQVFRTFPAKKAMRVLVRIITDPYADSSWYSHTKLDGTHRQGGRGESTVGEHTWIEARLLERTWASMEAAAAKAEFDKNTAEASAQALKDRCDACGLGPFTRVSTNYTTGHARVVLSNDHRSLMGIIELLEAAR